MEKVEALELKIINEEEEIMRSDKETSSSVRAILQWRNRVARKISRHKALLSTLIATGVILVWRGIWEVSADIPVLSSSLVALALGVVILVFINRYTEIG